MTDDSRPMIKDDSVSTCSDSYIFVAVTLPEGSAHLEIPDFLRIPHRPPNGSALAQSTAMEFETVVRRVREEFLEMPGLRLTPDQATRLWGLDHDVCRQVIDSLIQREFLRWTSAGSLVRNES
jgi:hypothetical protein